MKLNILIIGYGKLGSHLYYALNTVTGINVTGIVKTSRQSNFSVLVKRSNVIFICVQDSRIKSVVKKLSGKKFLLKNCAVFHTSGSISSEALTSLKAKGAYIGSFHPVQTFESVTRKDKERFKDIYIAIEGDQNARNTGKKNRSSSFIQILYHQETAKNLSSYLLCNCIKLHELTCRTDSKNWS